MNCDRFHDCLDAFLAGSLDPETRSEVESHLGHCEECQSVVALLSESQSSWPDATIVKSVIARTSGRICNRVQEEFSSVDAVEPFALEHTEYCSECARVLSTLRRIEAVLPSLAALRPDADFTADVLMVTVPRPSLIRVYAGRVGDRLSRWLERPGAAQDFAYACTIVLVLLTSTPMSPFPQLPNQAMSLFGVAGAGVGAEPVLTRAWDAVSEVPAVTAVVHAGAGFAGGVQLRGQRAIRDLDRVGGGLGDVGAGLLDGDVGRFEQGAFNIGCGLESLWVGLRAPDAEPSGRCAEGEAGGTSRPGEQDGKESTR